MCDDAHQYAFFIFKPEHLARMATKHPTEMTALHSCLAVFSCSFR